MATAYNVLDSRDKTEIIEKINEHNASSESHKDLRTDVNDAMSTAALAKDKSTEAIIVANEAATKVDSVIGGNVLHKAERGRLVHVDDAFASKPLGVKAFGQTRQNLWQNPSGTSSGITVTSNEDGSMTFSGTSTNNFFISSVIYSLKPRSMYVLSIDKQIRASISIQPYGSDGWISDICTIGANGVKTNKGVFPENATRAVLMIQGTAGKTLSGTYRVMLREATEDEIAAAQQTASTLQEGGTADLPQDHPMTLPTDPSVYATGDDDFDWCPPGLNGVDELSIVTAGKNLLKFRDNLQPLTANGLTFTPNEDGTITVNGTATANDTDYYIVGTTWADRADANFPASDLVFSTNGIAKMYGFDSDGTYVISAIVNNGKSQIAASKVQACAKVLLYLSYAAGQGESNKRVYVQLELGSTATAYEPPSVTTTPIDLDGHALNSLPDGTRDELRIDGTGNVTLVQNVGVSKFDGDENWMFTPNRIGLNNGAPGCREYVRTNGFCDTIPTVGIGDSSCAINAYASGWVDIRNESVITSTETGKAWLAANPTTYLYPLSSPKTTDLGTVSMPDLASPSYVIYASSDVPCDVELDYIRDVNIVIGKLETAVAINAVNIASK